MMQMITDFPADAVWLNTDRPLLMSRDLKGCVVLLHFFTRSCIHCLHTLQEIEKLRTRFANAPLVIIGVHTNKYGDEPLSGLQSAIERYDIRHPVVVGPGAAAIWERYEVAMWPTFVLLGADGQLLGAVSGEGHLKLLEHNIDRALQHSRIAGTLATTSIPLQPPAPDTTPLRFPTKILGDQNRIAIVDSGHHRLLVGQLDNHTLHITHTIGSGHPGNTDGPFASATFNAPHGAALRGDILFIADTSNHLVRRADLRTRTVTTLLGTGRKLFDHEAGKSGREQALNSPWDLAVHGNRLYIAQTGQHQIFAMNLMTGATEVAAGTARENLRDGPAHTANLAQPSALALDPAMQTLYFLDAQSSALRALDLKSKTVKTLIGEGLFDFGDIDGPLESARLTNPLGLTFLPSNPLLLADTFNHKLKRIDLRGARIETIPLCTDLFEPESVLPLDPEAHEILVADTGNHRILRVNTITKEWKELRLAF
jgi:thiol-disulfide isomerase/thioredoxin